ncbi:general odorant-binding protein 1-like [Trichoplusia ni]|uniref:General odorant-binding protein 1-like n=1 Tax=Trichoplusia ni TaxID=7111 RepID=A0A7E5WBK2_TRINI|nr:general odorant-binding protein 1-like [Trichoplusia ni]
MGNMEIWLLFLSLLICVTTDKEVSVMRELSASIGDVVLECQAEMHFNNDIIHDFLNYWSEKNELVDNDMGCVVLCVLVKMELMDQGGHVQKEETDVFLRAMGADDRIAAKVVELFELCQRATSAIKDLCDFALQVAKCFRFGIIQLHWAPRYVKPQTDALKRKRGNRTNENNMKRVDQYMSNGNDAKPFRRRGRQDYRGRRHNKKSRH